MNETTQTDIGRALRLFSSPGAIIEIRALHCWDRSEEFKSTRIGYFDESHLAEAEAAALDAETTWHAAGVYITLNPVRSDVQGRAANRMRKGQSGEATKNGEIVKRRWLLIDFDPKRPAGISSSADELQAARDLARDCREWLSGYGFPRPVVGMSGNGVHLLFAIDLPTDDGGLVERCLTALDQKFTTAAVGVDTGVHNAGRITKLFGTTARKGDHTEDRPHRRSELIDVPDELQAVTRDQLEWLAGQYVPPVKSNGHTNGATSGNGNGESVDVESYLTRNRVDVFSRDITDDGAARWFIRCPGEAAHTTQNGPRDCCVTQDASGKLGGHCLHSSCGMRDWQSLKAAIGAVRSADFPGGAAAAGGTGGTRPEPEANHAGAGAGADPGIGSPAIVRNFRLVEVDTDGESKLVPEPVSIDEIGNKITTLTDGWPARVGGSLFVPNHDNQGVAWLDDADSFGAWIGRRTGHPADFRGMPGYHTKRELFAHHRMTAKQFDAVEELPHEPLMAGHYYACPIPASGTGDRLRELLNRFSPETDIDRDLILALIATTFWGGRGGRRPAFCLTAEEGRGVGKTELALLVAELCGGAIEVAANEDIGAIKTRLLSPDAQAKRVILLDNVKTYRFSCAEFESLITAPVISGRRMYVGEAQRPNLTTFIMTMNGCGLSTDMAQRTVTIKLRRPDYSGSWGEETRQFIQDHRAELVADILGFLRSPAVTLTKFTRWGDWERDVLSRLPEPGEAQAVIRERQVGVDVDSEESELIWEFITKQLAWLGYDTTTDRVFIPASVAAAWYCRATGEKCTTARASRAVKQRIQEGQLRQLIICPNRVNGRGFEFWGDDATGDTYLQRDIESQIRNRGEGQIG